MPLLIAAVVSFPPGHAAEPVVGVFRLLAAQAAAPLSLDDCLALAAQKQPALAAYRASLEAAQDGQRTLGNLRFPATLVHDLPIRKQQAALGVRAAAATLAGAEYDTAYAVTRTYFTVLYARAQEKVAAGVVERLKATHDLAARMLKGGARDVAETDVDRAAVYLDLAETRRIEAAKGIDRALAALREAIGLAPGDSLEVADAPLPQPQARPDRQAVVADALARRGDIVAADAFAEITCLEAAAQGLGHHQRMETFAAYGDIHARPVPQEMHDGEYRPGGVPPEMPAMLAGSPVERSARACAFSQRAAAVAQKTRNLVALEAEDAFRRWEEASQKAEKAGRAAATGDKFAGNMSKDLAAGQKVRVEDVINAHVLASQARSQYNQFLHEAILALADLERITAGAFRAGLTGPAAPPRP